MNIIIMNMSLQLKFLNSEVDVDYRNLRTDVAAAYLLTCTSQR